MLPDDLSHALSALRDELQERYRLESEIGRGGAAVVFRAYDVEQDRRVAMKVLRPELSSSLWRDRFIREIRIESRLGHPNIVTVLDSGEAGGLLYYTMPLVEGESLRDRLAREPQLPVDDALRITKDVGRALAHAHSEGIVHRDIKPGNILLAGDSALVADFGIARAFAAAGAEPLTKDTVTFGTPTGVAVGTPEYMSPEQVAGDRTIEGRSDQYSLACVLFEMLAGDPPFTGRSNQSIINRHLLEPVPSLELRRQKAPHGVSVAVDRALSKVPADRFPSVGAFIEALEADVAPPKRSLAIRYLPWLAAPVAVAIGLWLWAANGRESDLLDVNKVAVFPLVEHGLRDSDRGAGYDVAIIVTTAFEQAAPLRWIDVRPRLTEAERVDPASVPPERAARITRARGARYYVSGIVRGGDSASVHLRLYDAAADTLVTQQSSAPMPVGTSFTDLGLSAAKELLSDWLDPGRTVDLSSIQNRNADAIAFWVLGERAFRLSRFEEALESYRMALAHDSALVLAAVKGAQAANWKSDYEIAYDLSELALRHRDLLPPKYEKLTRGLQAYFVGQADSAVTWLERALVDEPEWPEAHAILGEVYYHLIPLTSRPINTMAREAFEHAISVDSAFSEPLMHLAEFAIRDGDVDKGRALLARMEHNESEPELRAQLRFMLRCVENGAPDDGWRAAIPEESIHPWRAATALTVGGLHYRCAEPAMDMLLAADISAGERWGAYLALQGILATTGRTDELLVLLDSVASEFGSDGLVEVERLLIVDALAGAAVYEEADSVVRSLRRSGGEGFERIPNSGTLWLLGCWYAAEGDRSSLQEVRERLAYWADSLGRPIEREYVLSLAAQTSLLEGDTAAAVSALEDVVPVVGRGTLNWTLTAAHHVDRILLARLQFAEGKWREAIATASVFDHPAPIAFVPFLSASLVLRHAAALHGGDRRQSQQFARRLEELGLGHLVSDTRD